MKRDLLPIRETVLLCASANWKTAKPVPKLRKHFGNQSCGKHRNRTYLPMRAALAGGKPALTIRIAPSHRPISKHAYHYRTIERLTMFCPNCAINLKGHYTLLYSTSSFLYSVEATRVCSGLPIRLPSACGRFSGFVTNPRFIWLVPLVAEVRLEHTTIGYEPIKFLITLLRNKNGCVVLGVVHTIVTDQSCRLLLNDFTFSALSHHSVVCPIAPRTLTGTYLCTHNMCIPQSAGRGNEN